MAHDDDTLRTGNLDAVVFDYGGIIGVDTCECMLGELGLAAIRGLPSPLVTTAFRKTWKAFACRPESASEPAADQERLFWRQLLTELGCPEAVDEAIAQTDDYIRPVDSQMRDLLLRLRGGGNRLALLSNQVTFLRDRILRTQRLSEIFDAEQMTWSCDPDLRESKSSPTLKPFQVALGKLGNVHPNRVLFFDDRGPNCLRAIEAGLTAVQVPPLPGCAGYVERVLKLLGCPGL